MWKQSYEQKRLYEIIFEGLMQQMDLDSLETFADIAFQCLQKFRQERPTMSDVVEKLTIALEMQEDHDTIGNLPKKYDQIIKAAGDPLNYTSLEELKALLSKGVLLNGGKTVSIYLALDKLLMFLRYGKL
uniref:Protein kinase-like domain, phloem protein 2-like protein n=1 Tax=Tanacetum cinerariifolium TaxID=118510 RepID=A0A699V769_TANCI|nr:protein kinase-like domain, phloem protein 2-like protein [Tanacetum cinerariifolium]